MASWRQKSQRAFRFWLALLQAWNQESKSQDRYDALIDRLNRFERQSHETFQYLVERRADPVYLLTVMIKHCDENQVKHYVGFPQVFTVEKSGTFPDNLGDFRLLTESDMKSMEAAGPALERAGLTSALTHIDRLRQEFEALPPPPSREGYVSEKAILHTEFPHPVPDPPPRTGRPGEYYFNTAMVLLDRHLEQTAPKAARYPSIALLLNAFCPASFHDAPLSKGSVRQRILSTEHRVESYCQFIEGWFVDWKLSLQRHPVPFDPWDI